MTQEKKEYIERILSKFTFVQWDRFVDTDQGLKFYGWIVREKDAYKDFILLTIKEDGSIGYTTSSVEYTPQIHKVLGIYKDDTVSCERVEEFYNIENAIKL